MNNAIPILSLLIAILAVFVGPIISWRDGRRQMATALVVANKQIIAPMRQTWINSLRDLIAEITSKALHYYVAGFEERTDAEYEHLPLLKHKISMMLNLAEDDHQQLECAIARMVSSLNAGKREDQEFKNALDSAHLLARLIFKRKWNRVKDEISIPK